MEGDDMMRENQLEESLGEAMTLQIEELGSGTRLRVLSLIAKHGSINISLLARKAGMNHTQLERHIEKLVGMGLVEEKRYGALRIIKASFSSFSVQFKKGLGIKMLIQR